MKFIWSDFSFASNLQYKFVRINKFLKKKSKIKAVKRIKIVNCEAFLYALGMRKYVLICLIH